MELPWHPLPGDGPRAEIRSPWDGALAGTVPVADDAALEAAIAGAAAAFAVTRAEPRHRRSAVCRRVSEAIAADADGLATLIARESGKPIRYARAEVSRAVSTFAIAAEEANRVGGEMVPLDISPAGEGFLGMSVRVPAGPVCAIAPFNFPLNLVAHKVAPALAAGCPVVLKPAPQAPLTSFRLAEIVAAAGAAPGALAVLHMPVPLAQRMAEDPRFALLTFTGSGKVGWALKAAAGHKRVTLELGGNAPAIVHGDADLAHAVERCVLGAFASAGQVCIKLQRLFVHRPLFAEFRERFVAAARALPTGDPMDEATVIGPLIDGAAADRVMAWIDEARASGAKVLCGGTREGAVVAATVIEPGDVDVNAFDSLKVSCEEVFGPVVTLEPYDDFDDALARANAGQFGLQAAVFTKDLYRARRAAEALDYGGVIVNESPMFRTDNFPYGGTRASGHGREGVKHAMDDMLETKMLVIGPKG